MTANTRIRGSSVSLRSRSSLATLTVVKKRSLAVAALMVAVTSSLSACSMTAYEKCVKSATDSWEDQQESNADNGMGNSVGGYMRSLDSYIYDQCGVESDERYKTSS